MVTFPNLGKDALLVSPCFSKKWEKDAYTHLANFVRFGPEDQVSYFWKTVGQSVIGEVNNLGNYNKSKRGSVWLSTNGMGVSWLHCRLDSSPKYYQFDDYRYESPQKQQASFVMEQEQPYHSIDKFTSSSGPSPGRLSSHNGDLYDEYLPGPSLVRSSPHLDDERATGPSPVSSSSHKDHLHDERAATTGPSLVRSSSHKDHLRDERADNLCRGQGNVKHTSNSPTSKEFKKDCDQFSHVERAARQGPSSSEEKNCNLNEKINVAIKKHSEDVAVVAETDNQPTSNQTYGSFYDFPY